MSRLALLAVGAFALVLLSGAPAVLAKGEKVKVCHITGEGLNQNGDELWTGHVIEVSVNAEAAHCRHGDHNLGIPGKGIGDPCQRRKDGPTVTCAGDAPVDPN